MKDCDGMHEKVVKDRFAEVPGVSRSVPGDCFCLDCGQPIPAYWNSGHPKAVKGFDKPELQ